MRFLPDRSSALLPFRTADGSRPPVRVGIAVNGPRPSRWVEALLAFFDSLPGIETRAIPVSQAPSERDRTPPWLTDRLYRVNRQKSDPFGPGKLELPPTEPIENTGCDLVIWLASGGFPAAPPRSVARYGVLTVAMGEKAGAIPYWHEIASGQPWSPTTIYWHDSSFSRRRPVLRIETASSQGLYFTANSDEPVAAAIRLLAGIALGLRENPEATVEKLRQVSEEPLPADRPNGFPSSLSVGRFIADKLTRSAMLRWTTRGKKPRWFIAARPNTGKFPTRNPVDLHGFRDVPLPKGSEAIADPFVHESGGRTWLLFEDVPAGKSRARLSAMEMRADGSFGDLEIVLERDYHLSYPCVVESGGEIFLMPESCEANRVDLFRFRRFPGQLELAATPVEGVGLVDTTPLLVDGKWYFFTTTVQPFMESLLFWSDRLEGPWKLHPSNPISCSVRNSRGAGNLFWKDGRLYRPTQDCSVRYGYAMTINEVTRLTPGEFAEKPVAWVGPSWSPGLLATHTWNESSRFQVIDGIRLTPA
jgi:hypothetical protein